MPVLRPVLLLAVAAVAYAQPFLLQTVEFPYQSLPPVLWERELVWLKNIGVRSVTLPAGTAMHRLPDGGLDLTGVSSPRAALVPLLQLLKKLDLHAWVRIEDAAFAAQAAAVLEPLLAAHGGPVDFSPALAPPQPLEAIPVSAPDALIRARAFLERRRGTLLWTSVEPALEPAAAAGPGSIFRIGAVSFSGDESAATNVLRRHALLLEHWEAAIPALRLSPKRPRVTPPAKELSIREFVAGSAGASSALSLVNRGNADSEATITVWDPGTKRSLELPRLKLPKGEALWIPLFAPLATSGLCSDCSALAPSERLVYTTAELTSLSFEQGVLSLEFYAPHAGEAVLRLNQRPDGPLLAGGGIAQFTWDAATSLLRLPVPAGRAPRYRTRIGIALSPPESTGFLGGSKRLIRGEANRLTATFSSEDLAGRSRLLAPAGFQVTRKKTSPLEWEYLVTPPADTVHGAWAAVAIEADGRTLGKTRLQIFRPVSLRVPDTVMLQVGEQPALPAPDSILPYDPVSGRTLRLTIRNHFPGIQSYRYRCAVPGLDFLPAEGDVAVAGAGERDISLRVLPAGKQLTASRGGCTISGAAPFEAPLQFVAIGRTQPAAFTADLDGDGSPEYILESPRMRAVLSAPRGGTARWLSFLWKDSGASLLSGDTVLSSGKVNDVRLDAEAGSARLVIQLEQGEMQLRLTAGGQLQISSPSRLPSLPVRPKVGDVRVTALIVNENSAFFSASIAAESSTIP